MSIEIRIGIADDNVSADTLDRHMQALGFTRHVEVRNVGYIGGDVGGVVAEARETEAAAGENVAKTEAPKATRTRKKADDKPTANISANPEDRKPPEDDEVTQAQDAADEQAEVEAAREPEKAITVDDLRGVMGEYVQKFEMPATQEDGPLIFADALGKPPAGEAAWKLSLLAELPQERLKAAYDGWRAAVDSGKRYQKRG